MNCYLHISVIHSFLEWRDLRNCLYLNFYKRYVHVYIDYVDTHLLRTCRDMSVSVFLWKISNQSRVIPL